MEEFKSTTEVLLKVGELSETMVATSHPISLIVAPTTISCLMNFLVTVLVSRCEGDLKKHREKLEQSYWENDVLFSMKKLRSAPGKGNSRPCMLFRCPEDFPAQTFGPGYCR